MRGAAAFLWASLAMITLASSAAASPAVHAHRGGPLATVDGQQVPVYPENTMPAFRDSARRGFVLELDVKLTRDRIPMVFHDADLERVTDCAGLIAEKLAAGLRECAVDILGTEGNSIELDADDPRRARIPTMARVLRLAERTGVAVNLELKNIPTDADFDLSPAFANRVVDGVVASGFPLSRLIVQSFWPPNLDVVEARLPRAETSLLTLRDPPAPFNELGPAFALARGYEWVSPQWPIDPLGLTPPAFVAEAHALGLRVVPWTLDEPGAVCAAAGAGVDAVISNDPRMARRAAASPAC